VDADDRYGLHHCPKGLGSTGLIKWMWMARQADLVQSIADGFPLHEMTTINLVTVKAIPNIGTAQCCFRPIVSLALHFLSVLVLPVNPINTLIWRDIVVEDYHRELHRFVSTLNTTIGNAASSQVELTRWRLGLDFLAWENRSSVWNRNEWIRVILIIINSMRLGIWWKKHFSIPLIYPANVRSNVCKVSQ